MVKNVAMFKMLAFGHDSCKRYLNPKFAHAKRF